MKCSIEEAQFYIDSFKEKPSVESLKILLEYPDLGNRIKILWHSDYWDGPLSGYVTLDGNKGYWFKCIEDLYDTRLDLDDECKKCTCDKINVCFIWSRLYLVYKMTDEQESIMVQNHNLFREHVGTHTDYNKNEESKVFPRDSHHKFYDIEKPVPPEFVASQIVGWTTNIYGK